jgi:hypothetical protein
MNRKDLETLSESYGKIFENTIAGMIADELPNEAEPAIGHNPLSNDVSAPQEAPSDISIGISGNDGSGDIATDKTKEMNITNIKSLIAHANKALGLIESGKPVDAWMTDKLAVASDYIVDVANCLEFGS